MMGSGKADALGRDQSSGSSDDEASPDEMCSDEMSSYKRSIYEMKAPLPRFNHTKSLCGSDSESDSAKFSLQRQLEKHTLIGGSAPSHSPQPPSEATGDPYRTLSLVRVGRFVGILFKGETDLLTTDELSPIRLAEVSKLSAHSASASFDQANHEWGSLLGLPSLAPNFSNAFHKFGHAPTFPNSPFRLAEVSKLSPLLNDVRFERGSSLDLPSLAPNFSNVVNRFRDTMTFPCSPFRLTEISKLSALLNELDLPNKFGDTLTSPRLHRTRLKAVPATPLGARAVISKRAGLLFISNLSYHKLQPQLLKSGNHSAKKEFHGRKARSNKSRNSRAIELCIDCLKFGIDFSDRLLVMQIFESKTTGFYSSPYRFDYYHLQESSKDCPFCKLLFKTLCRNSDFKLLQRKAEKYSEQNSTSSDASTLTA